MEARDTRQRGVKREPFDGGSRTSRWKGKTVKPCCSRALWEEGRKGRRDTCLKRRRQEGQVTQVIS